MIGRESYSSPIRNTFGAALRSSPKVILTVPCANWGNTFSTDMEMLADDKFAPVVIDLDRKSGGNFSKIGNNGISNSDPVAARAGMGEYGAGATPGRD